MERHLCKRQVFARMAALLRVRFQRLAHRVPKLIRLTNQRHKRGTVIVSKGPVCVSVHCGVKLKLYFVLAFLRRFSKFRTRTTEPTVVALHC
jgi:hypothetical protein